MQLAFVCRYAHQDIYRLLARDPSDNPLSPMELALFERATLKHTQAEFEAKAGGFDHRGE